MPNDHCKYKILNLSESKLSNYPITPFSPFSKSAYSSISNDFLVAPQKDFLSW